jgi:hypothetical protein
VILVYNVLSRPANELFLRALDTFLVQVDNVHASLYKALNPSCEQRDMMANFWSCWELKRRQLDEETVAARKQLHSLPGHIALSTDFITHVNVLALHGVQPSDASSSVSSRASCIRSDSFRNTARASSTAQMEETTHKQQPEGMFGTGTCAATSWPPAELESPLVDVKASAFRDTKYAWSNPHVGMELGDIRLLGQHPEEMDASACLLRQLWRVHTLDRDMQVGIIDLQLSVNLLEADQLMRLWAEHFVAQLCPPDFLALCQLAAHQKNRQNLFHLPF